MYKRDVRLYVADIMDSIRAVEEFTATIDYAFFFSDRKTYSATLREFIVIGEGIANIPEQLRERFPEIPWRQIKDFRNFIVHEYFGVDPEIVWDAVKKELPLLKSAITSLHSMLGDQNDLHSEQEKQL